jgi:hypothetical protein
MHYLNDINLVPKMGQTIKVQRTVSLAPINGLYHRPLLGPVCDIRGRIYNSFAGGIIVQCLLNTFRYN